MPIYEYLCPDGHRFEVVQRFSDEPVTVCEVCGKVSDIPAHELDDLTQRLREHYAFAYDAVTIEELERAVTAPRSRDGERS